MLNIECKCDNGIWVWGKFGRFFKKIDEIGEYLDVSDDFWDRNERQYWLTAMRLLQESPPFLRWRFGRPTFCY